MSFNLDSFKESDVNFTYNLFMKCIIDALNESAPQCKKHKQNPVPWWTKDCSIKIKERNKAKKIKYASSIYTSPSAPRWMGGGAGGAPPRYMNMHEMTSFAFPS